MKLLHLDSSILGPASVSRELSHLVVDHIREHNPSVTAVYHDLVTDPLPHLWAGLLGPGSEDVGDLDVDAARKAGDAAMEEFLEADVIVIGAPMYNFTVPTQLKSWVDRVLIAGKTFRYTEHGPEGLMGAKRVIVASARGNVYTEPSPNVAFDCQERFLQASFGLMGVHQVEIIRAEGLALGPEQRAAALGAAKAAIAKLHV